MLSSHFSKENETPKARSLKKGYVLSLNKFKPKCEKRSPREIVSGVRNRLRRGEDEFNLLPNSRFDKIFNNFESQPKKGKKNFE